MILTNKFVVEGSSQFEFEKKIQEDLTQKDNFWWIVKGPIIAEILGFNFWIKLFFFEAFAN